MQMKRVWLIGRHLITYISCKENYENREVHPTNLLLYNSYKYRENNTKQRYLKGYNQGQKGDAVVRSL